MLLPSAKRNKAASCVRRRVCAKKRDTRSGISLRVKRSSYSAESNNNFSGGSDMLPGMKSSAASRGKFCRRPLFPPQLKITLHPKGPETREKPPDHLCAAAKSSAALTIAWIFSMGLPAGRSQPVPSTRPPPLAWANSSKRVDSAYTLSGVPRSS